MLRLQSVPSGGLKVQIVTLAVISLLFGVIFKVPPDAMIKRRDVIYGSVVTVLLFMLGKFAISIYIGQSDVAVLKEPPAPLSFFYQSVCDGIRVRNQAFSLCCHHQRSQSRNR